MKNCRRCGQIFEENKEEKIYCSLKCSNLHKEYKKNYMIKYYKEHKEEMNECNKKNHKNRLKIDIKFKLTHNLRTRIWSALKGISKYSYTEELIGCNIEFLKKHLESQFVAGMTWNNYGVWHIDHIRPCSSFDLSEVLEQRKCFNYNNLQPLWAHDNRVKKDNILI
jgi:hypothetical protein